MEISRDQFYSWLNYCKYGVENGSLARFQTLIRYISCKFTENTYFNNKNNFLTRQFTHLCAKPSAIDDISDSGNPKTE